MGITNTNHYTTGECSLASVVTALLTTRAFHYRSFKQIPVKRLEVSLAVDVVIQDIVALTLFLKKFAILMYVGDVRVHTDEVTTSFIFKNGFFNHAVVSSFLLV